MILNSSDKIQKYLTPFKYGKPVLAGSGTAGAFDSRGVDIPFVFLHNERFYMLYTGYDGSGYRSALAVSDDLLNWTPQGIILDREAPERWDTVGGAATWMIKESNRLEDVPRLKKIDGKYWLVYHSYPQNGYEAGPAEIGLAWCDDESLMKWHRLDKPVFSWKDGADWERGGLYKACILEKDGMYYMFYNAKNTDARWIEQTGLATSKDLVHWERCPQNPILKVEPESWHERFLSDPYILQDGDVWLNFFFGYGNGHAQEGLALSKDLVHWEKVENPILPHGEAGEIDANHAHKASILMYKGVLYHFYCATRPVREGDKTEVFGEFRTITVAASAPFEK